ncbi:MAG: anti-ECFsigma factor, ChrR, partial [Rhodospirillales bacterium]|nr:anti-ECFsigma factor, ChrR [Rhodospirillales bacterium]
MKHVMPPIPNSSAQAPVYHPAESFLLDYAAGTASSGETLMIATHLAFCETCRLAVHVAQSVGGNMLDALEPARLPPNMLNRTLAAIDAGGESRTNEPPLLSAFLSENFASPHWKRLPGGFRMRRIPGRDDGGRVWLFDAPPGMKLLPHRHKGDEWTVILSGVFVDNEHSYRIGDFACLADGEEHRPMTGQEGRCVSLMMVREAPHYTT